jgi:hypothetical protein
MAKFLLEMTGTVTAECYIEAETEEEAKKKFLENPSNHQEFHEVDTYDWEIVRATNLG